MTAQAVEQAGAKSLIVAADLTDRPSVNAAADRVLAEWGPVDVLVNNGRYIGPGHMDRFLDTPLELLSVQLEANVMAPLDTDQEISARHARARIWDRREHHLGRGVSRPPSARG